MEEIYDKYIKFETKALIERIDAQIDEVTDYTIDNIVERSPNYDENNADKNNKIYDDLINELYENGITSRYDEKKHEYVYDRRSLVEKGYNEILDYLDENNINYEVSRSKEAGYVPSIYLKNETGDTIFRIANHYNSQIDDFDKTYNNSYNTIFKDKDYVNWKENILPKIKEYLVSERIFEDQEKEMEYE